MKIVGRKFSALFRDFAMLKAALHTASSWVKMMSNTDLLRVAGPDLVFLRDGAWKSPVTVAVEEMGRGGIDCDDKLRLLLRLAPLREEATRSSSTQLATCSAIRMNSFIAAFTTILLGLKDSVADSFEETGFTGVTTESEMRASELSKISCNVKKKFTLDSIVWSCCRMRMPRQSRVHS